MEWITALQASLFLLSLIFLDILIFGYEGLWVIISRLILQYKEDKRKKLDKKLDNLKK